MNSSLMMAQIESAVSQERQGHGLRDALAQAARMNGARPDARALDDAVQFVTDYVKHVPVLLVVMHAAAQDIGAEESIQPLLDSCEQYWIAGFDVIPDHLGLVGYMDDAYYVLSILQGIADRHRQRDGAPLMNLELAPMNQVMRVLIGEPHASILDGAIAAVMNGPDLNAMLRGIPFMSQPLVDRDPIWGNASIDEIVNARMGALGIV